MTEKIKFQVFEAFRLLASAFPSDIGHICISARARLEEKDFFIITPKSPPHSLTARSLTVTDQSGNVLSGKMNADIATHIEIYRAFPEIGSIVHTHSLYASSFAQAGRSIKPYGVTHAESFRGAIPCTARLSPNEISEDYEKNIGKAIVESFEKLDFNTLKAVLVHSHGAYCWDHSPIEAASLAIELERSAHLAFNTELLQVSVGPGGAVPMQSDLVNKVFDK